MNKNTWHLLRLYIGGGAWDAALELARRHRLWTLSATIRVWTMGDSEADAALGADLCRWGVALSRADAELPGRVDWALHLRERFDQSPETDGRLEALIVADWLACIERDRRQAWGAFGSQRPSEDVMA